MGVVERTSPMDIDVRILVTNGADIRELTQDTFFNSHMASRGPKRVLSSLLSVLGFLSAAAEDLGLGSDPCRDLLGI